MKPLGGDSVVVGEQYPHRSDDTGARARNAALASRFVRSLSILGAARRDNPRVASQAEILTVGHSTHEAERLVRLLRAHRVELVADVRRFPGSRRHPQFDAGALAATLAGAGIAYEPLGDRLGGRRRARAGSRHTEWRVAAFRAYADHMETEEFTTGLERLEQLARERRTAIMCAEGDWRRCHRRLISDALAGRGWRVIHIRPDGRGEEHQPTVFEAARDP
jgi:uncharacterized protein (DUF488 family)